MDKFYIVSGSYYPTSAGTNRLMGFIKAFSQMGLKVDVVYFMPDKQLSKAPVMDNVTYHYYWRYLPITNRLRFLLFQFAYSYIFISKLKKGDTVFLYACDDLLTKIIRKKGINIYYERTEHTKFARTRFLNYDKFFKACKKVKGLFLISTGLMNHFFDNGVSTDKVKIINMTVDKSRFVGLQKKVHKDTYIAYCGSLSNNKDGVDELIKSFAIVHKEKPELKLYIIGRYSKEKEGDENLKLIDTLQLNDSVVLTGSVSPIDIPQILKDAEVLVLDRPNSIQAECGFPTKLGEYLLTENPVVVTNVGDISKFLEDGVSARIANDRDPDDFASKVLWCLNNPKEASKMGKKGAEIALKNFDSFTEASKIYDYIIENNEN